MSGETEANVSGWTTDTLHSLMAKLLDERAKEFDARFAGQEEALRLARDADLRHLASVVHTVETRFAAMDKATDLLSETVNRVPTNTDRQVGQLKAVHDERFVGVEAKIADVVAGMKVRFEERDTRSEREARDNRVAVDAAFAAQKEAVAEQNKSNALAIAKSETAVAKQIDSLAAAVDSKFKATDDKIDDLKVSLSSMATQLATLSTNVASRRTYESEAQTQSNWTNGQIISAALGTVGLLVSIVVAIVLILHH